MSLFTCYNDGEYKEKLQMHKEDLKKDSALESKQEVVIPGQEITNALALLVEQKVVTAKYALECVYKVAYDKGAKDAKHNQVFSPQTYPSGQGGGGIRGQYGF